jgi:hypothetical protein
VQETLFYTSAGTRPRPTDHGLRVMTAALQLRQRQFPDAYATAAN